MSSASPWLAALKSYKRTEATGNDEDAYLKDGGGPDGGAKKGSLPLVQRTDKTDESSEYGRATPPKEAWTAESMLCAGISRRNSQNQSPKPRQRDPLVHAGTSKVRFYQGKTESDETWIKR